MMNENEKQKYIDKLLSGIPKLDGNINLNNIGKTKKEVLLENALKKAWEIRNFEIQLYWKRALYFWGFIALTFGGLITVLNMNTELFSAHFLSRNAVVLLVCAVGTILSYSWYLVNRASKRWQENWELWICYLEENIYGNLYQTPIDFDNLSKLTGKKYIDWNSCGMYSVSKINILVSLLIVLVWTGLSLVFAFEIYRYAGALAILVLLSMLCLIFQRLSKSTN